MNGEKNYFRTAINVKEKTVYAFLKTVRLSLVYFKIQNFRLTYKTLVRQHMYLGLAKHNP